MNTIPLTFTQRLKNIFRRLFLSLFILFLIMIGLFLFRAPILQKVGDSLVHEDSFLVADAMFVLGAGTYERAVAASKLFKSGNVEKIVGTGEMVSPLLAAVGCKSMDDATLTKTALVALGIDSTKIETLSKGTSTYEEAEAILQYAEQQELKQIVILTSMHHTQRVRLVFKKLFAYSSTQVIIRGAYPINYQLTNWWEYEEGLIFVANEYLKLMYYKLKRKI
ncbi:MAG: YdcF family protein [Bacteroidales bacterium]